MADKDVNANVMHYGSRRCQCNTLSFMAAEVSVLVHAVGVVMITGDAWKGS